VSAAPLRIVGIGGGTGLPLLMQGLSELEEARSGPPLCLTAIVSVSDDGGSSGRLRKAFRVPALGDIRNCLLGLGRRRTLLSQLFGYRFSNGRGLAGHTLGNLILTALYQQAGSLRKAIDVAAEAMQVAGSVLPVTEVPVTLCAQGADGRRARGECAIVRSRLQIARVWLEPQCPPPSRGVLECLDAADAIVLGPGSLFTSVVPPLLVAGVAEAIRRSRARKIYVCNLMGEPGETDGFTAADHLRALERHLGPRVIDVCVLNTRHPQVRVARRYLATGAGPVEPDLAAVEALGVEAVVAELLAESGPKARHDPPALARLVVELSGKPVRTSPQWEELCAASSGT
jgi:uncharacterized cofD-like protein